MAPPKYSAKQVGIAFTNQYYLLWKNSPEKVYMFYKDSSKLTRPEPDGTTSITTTIDNINHKLMRLREHSTWKAMDVLTVDAHEDPSSGGVFVAVTGYLTEKDDQKFYLAPQEGGGYFLESDVLSYPDGSSC